MMKKRVLALLLSLAMTVSLTAPVLADREQDIRNSQAQTQSALDSNLAKIEEDTSITASLDAEIVDLDTQALNLMTSIGVLEEDIAYTEEQIAKTRTDLKAAYKKRDAQKEGMKARIQYLYENGQSLSFLSYLLSADNLEDFLNRVSYAQDLSQYDRDQLLAYEECIREIETIRNNLINSKSILEEEKLSLDGQYESLEGVLNEKKQQSANYKAEVEALRARAAELTAQISAQNAELRRIEEEKRLEEERRRKAEEEERQRQAAESERLRQESIAAEKARQEAEAAEKARKEAEAAEQARKEAEAAEQARKEAEAAEKARLEAEAAAAEKARLAAEAEAAEKARLAAEEKARKDAAAAAEAEKARLEAEKKAAEAEKARRDAEEAEKARREAEEAAAAAAAAEEAARQATAQSQAEAAAQSQADAADQSQAAAQSQTAAPTAAPTATPVPQSTGVYSDGRALGAAAQGNAFYQSTGCMYQTGARPGPNAAYATDNANLGVQIADYAVQFNGIPYIRGGANLVTGCDCSGFVYAIYQHFGVTLSRDPNIQGTQGRPVSLAEAKPGDIVVYMNHSAIYIGNNTIINASEPGVGVVIRSPVTYRGIVTIRRIFDY